MFVCLSPEVRTRERVEEIFGWVKTVEADRTSSSTLDFIRKRA
jgi:hypothetical protein